MNAYNRIMKKRNYILLLAIGFLVLATGCKKFLDIRPDNLVFEEDLFEARDGFESALADIYDRLGTSSLYGREMKFGLMDAMVGYWQIPVQQHTYTQATAMDFSQTNNRTRVDAMWSGLYNAINKTNHILKNIDRIKGDDYYDLVRGEALGLRAFLHLELLRLFGPVIKEEGLGERAIPYYKEVKNNPQPFKTAGEVLQLIEEDLVAAEKALENDPIRTYGRTGNGNGYGSIRYNSLLDRRGIRMNYLAVLGLKARKSMWEGNLEEAYNRAEFVINNLNGAVRLINASDVASSYQRINRFTPENLFGLYARKQRDLITAYLPDIANLNTTASSVLLPQYTWYYNNYYNNSVHGSVNDYRLQNWFAQTSNSQYRFVKLEINPDDTEFLHQFEIPMVALPEMYFIMAEAKAHTDPEAALEILNRFRLSRNLSTPIPYDEGVTTTQSVIDYVFAEATKEYVGEGMMYLMYKRAFRPIVRPTGTVQPSLSNMRFPIPVDEDVYNK